MKRDNVEFEKWIKNFLAEAFARMKMTLKDYERFKLETPLTHKAIDVKAIRLYPMDFKEIEVNSTIESGENPHLSVNFIKRESTGEPEFELFFKGQTHTEPINRNKKPRDDWRTWGEIVISPEQAKEIAQELLRVLWFLDFHNRPFKPKEGNDNT